MNDVSKEMNDWLAAADRERAEANLRWLLAHLKTNLFDGSKHLLDVIESDLAAHLQLFSISPPLSKAVEHTAVQMQNALSTSHEPTDIRLVHTVASMMMILRLECEEIGASPTTLSALDKAHEGAFRKTLSLASVQLEALARFLLKITSFLSKLAIGRSRFVLLEMPSGNSIAVKLLAILLKPYAHIEIVLAALSRANLTPVGISRQELLKMQLGAVKLAPNDIVIYIDEWETGVNFKTISEFLKKILPKETFLFTAAFMTDKAKSNERHLSFCNSHNAIMSSWGVDGEEFRQLLPPLPSTILGGYFLWSENDRMAGYRKMQLHGSIFSSIDSTIEELNQNPEALQAATQSLLES